jgi:hypothetical protein
MENNSLKIGFALIGIKTEQFATFNENLIDEENINLNSGIGFGFDKKHHNIAIFPKFTFESDGKMFLTIETSSHFNISPEAWKSFFNEETQKIKIPQYFMQHLCVIAIGTTRGILHAKTENTMLNKFLLPTINATEMITNDIEEDLSQE